MFSAKAKLLDRFQFWLNIIVPNRNDMKGGHDVTTNGL
jgi:hypothetical protein